MWFHKYWLRRIDSNNSNVLQTCNSCRYPWYHCDCWVDCTGIRQCLLFPSGTLLCMLCIHARHIKSSIVFTDLATPYSSWPLDGEGESRRCLLYKYSMNFSRRQRQSWQHMARSLISLEVNQFITSTYYYCDSIHTFYVFILCVEQLHEFSLVVSVFHNGVASGV